MRTTLNFLMKGDQLLLAMKKRSFGKGKWNGVGGKLQGTETIEEAIARETLEEIGVTIQKSDLEKVAIIYFYFADKPDWNQECHVFFTRTWKGDPVETEEMRPQWYLISKLPFDEMWSDDKHWLPLVLSGKKVKAEFNFIDSGASFDTWKVEEVKVLK